MRQTAGRPVKCRTKQACVCHIKTKGEEEELAEEVEEEEEAAGEENRKRVR